MFARVLNVSVQEWAKQILWKTVLRKFEYFISNTPQDSSLRYSPDKKSLLIHWLKVKHAEF